MSGKDSWPELLGQNVDEAVEQIKRENSSLKVIKVEENSPITRDLQRDRVRVFYDKDNKVVRPPKTG